MRKIGISAVGVLAVAVLPLLLMGMGGNIAGFQQLDRLRIGAGSTFDNACNQDDLCVEGTLEVDGATRLDGALDLNSTLDVSGAITAAVDLVKTPAASESIGIAGTITADSCGGIKQITATEAVTTSTDNTFESTTTAPSGCIMWVINMSSPTITLDFNTQFKSTTSANIIMKASDTVVVGAIAGRGWFQLNGFGL